MKQNIIVAVLFFSIVANIFCLSVIAMQDNDITNLEKHQVVESSECVNGVEYKTFSFKDLVVYEPKYTSCKDRK